MARSTKMTKKAYTQRKEMLTCKLGHVNRTLDNLAASNATATAEEWNALHDLQFDIEQDLETLEWAWETRNYTAVDWQQARLAAMNID